MCHEFFKSEEIKKSFFYVLLKPDVTIRNLLEEILSYFENLGLHIVDYRCGKLSENMYHLMYKDEFDYQLDSWSHNQKAYDFAPVIGVIFRNLKKIDFQGKSPQDFFSQNKGSALPEFLEKNTLRYRFRATSRVFNVLHIPATSEQAFIEAGEWFGKKTFPPLVRSSVALNQELQPVLEEIRNQGYLFSKYLNGQISFILVKIRFFHSLEKQVFLPQSLIKVLEELKFCFAQKIKNLCPNIKGTEKQIYHQNDLCKLEKNCFKQLKLFFSLAQREFEDAGKDKEIPKELKFVTQLSKTTPLKQSNLDYLWHLLKKWGVFVSEMERYLIQTYFLYPTVLNEKQI